MTPSTSPQQAIRPPQRRGWVDNHRGAGRAVVIGQGGGYRSTTRCIFLP